MVQQVIIDTFERLIKYYQAKIKTLPAGDEKKTLSFKLRQFRQALVTLNLMDISLTSGKHAQEASKELGLKGIGKGIGTRIDEILETGTLDELKQVVPQTKEQNTATELERITGIGPAKAKSLVEQGVKSVDDLKKKYENGKIKLTSHAVIGLKYIDDFEVRIPREEIKRAEKRIRHELSKLDKKIKMDIVGSYRRKTPDSGDIDVMINVPDIVTKEDLKGSKLLFKIVDHLEKAGVITDHLTYKANTKYMGVMVDPEIGIMRRIDIRIIPLESYVPALVHSTGSKNFNMTTRERAKKMGYKLSEYDLVHKDTNEPVIFEKEEDLFEFLGMPYIKPENRK